MKKMNKKGFTVVELVIVIAVIAVLAAVLIPTFAGIIHKADVSNDTQLVKNLNTALAADTTKNYTMTDALDAAKEFGYDIEKINASATDNEILWDSANNLFCYFNDGKIEYIPESTLKVPADQVEDYQYWVIDNEIPATQKYSIYYTGAAKEELVTLSVGFETSESMKLKYENTTGTAKNVILVTNGGELTVNAPDDVVRHYGESEVVDIEAIAPNSFHEFGKVDFISITAGKVQLEGQAVVGAVHAAAADVKLVVVGEAKVEKLSVETGVAAEDFVVEGTVAENIVVEEKTKDAAKNENVNEVIATAEELIKFLTEGEQTKAKLMADVELKDVEKYNITKNIELDLNGYTFTLNDAGSRPFEIQAGVTFTVDGEREGSKVVIPAEAGSYGIFALRGEGAALVLNGGEYNTTMNNGSIIKAFANNTVATLNNVKASTEDGMLYDFKDISSSALIVNGGEFIHGYAVDKREDETTYGIRCSFANVINSEWNNVKVVSKFTQVVYATTGETKINNCDFNVVSAVDDGYDYMNATIGVANEASVTVTGGTYKGEYALVLYPSGYNFVNDGGVFEGRVADCMQHAVYEGKGANVSGIDGLTVVTG